MYVRESVGLICVRVSLVILLFEPPSAFAVCILEFSVYNHLYEYTYTYILTYMKTYNKMHADFTHTHAYISKQEHNRHYSTLVCINVYVQASLTLLNIDPEGQGFDQCATQTYNCSIASQ